jgi:Rod binding domain-containing protein
MSLKIDQGALAPIGPTGIDQQATKPEKKDPAVHKVAQQYEAIFVNQLVTAMRKTVAKGGMVPESNAERVYQSMLDSEYSQRISETGQLGLSNLIYDHLMKEQGRR